MSLSLADRTRNFWSAATYLRRAPDRDPTVAVKVLQQVARVTSGRVQARAANLLKEIPHGPITGTRQN